MTEEQRQVILKLLRFNLDIDFDFYDAEAEAEKEEQLSIFVDAAVKFIETEGITLNFDDTGDQFLVVAYAEWLYDKRKDASSVMPRMLRYNINNRLFHEKLSEGN